MTDDALARFLQDYRPALLGWLGRQDEAARQQAYELGRAALADSIGLLDVVRLHHEAVLEVMRTAGSTAEAGDVARLAGEHLLELLAPFEIARRGFLDVGLGQGGAGEPSARRGPSRRSRPTP